MSILRYVHGDSETRQLNDSAANRLDPLLRNALTGGHIIENVSIAAYPTYSDVEHKLGRQYRGYVVVGKYGQGDISSDKANNTRPHQVVKLTSSAALTADVYFF